MEERRRIGAASRREAACRRLPLQTQRSQCALAVPRLEATGATRRNKSLRGFLRKSYILTTDF